MLATLKKKILTFKKLQYINLLKDIQRFGPKAESLFDYSSYNPYDSKQRMVNEATEFQRRQFFCKLYSWAIPSKTAINEIKKFVENDRILEIGSGKGLWAKLLRLNDVKIDPTDNNSWKKKEIGKRYLRVKNINHIDASKNTTNNCIMYCWPPYDSKMAFESIKTFNGKKVIYIGEGNGGCTGDSYFHDYLEDNFELVKCVKIKTWSHIHDRMYFYERKI